MGKRFKKKFGSCFGWDQTSSDAESRNGLQIQPLHDETKEEARLLTLEEDCELLTNRINAFEIRLKVSRQRYWAMMNKYLGTQSAELPGDIYQPSSHLEVNVVPDENSSTKGPSGLHAAFRITNHPGIREKQEIDSHRLEKSCCLQRLGFEGTFGRTLNERIKYWGMNTINMNGRTKILQPQQFDESHARFLSINILESLRYLHGLNVVHGRISPNNIVFTESGYPCLTGFERFKTKTDKLRPKIALRIDYASPEETQKKAVTNATDVFQTGILVYTLMYGKSPFKTETYEKTKARVLDKSFIPEFESGIISKNGRNFIQKLLKNKPNRRFKLDKCKKPLERTIKWFKVYPRNEITSQAFPSPFMEFLLNEKVDY